MQMRRSGSFNSLTCPSSACQVAHLPQPWAPLAREPPQRRKQPLLSSSTMTSHRSRLCKKSGRTVSSFKSVRSSIRTSRDSSPTAQPSCPGLGNPWTTQPEKVAQAQTTTCTNSTRLPLSSRLTSAPQRPRLPTSLRSTRQERSKSTWHH